MEIAIKEMRDKKATRSDDVPGDVLKLVEEGGLKIMIKLISTIHETGEWPPGLQSSYNDGLKEEATS